MLNYLHLLGTCNLQTYLQHAAGTQAHNQPVPAQVRYAAAAAAAAALTLIYPIPIYLIKLQPKVTYPCISIMYIHPISAYIPYFSLPVQHTHPYNHATRLHTTRLPPIYPPLLCTDSLTHSLTHSFTCLFICICSCQTDRESSCYIRIYTTVCTALYVGIYTHGCTYLRVTLLCSKVSYSPSYLLSYTRLARLVPSAYHHRRA